VSAEMLRLVVLSAAALAVLCVRPGYAQTNACGTIDVSSMNTEDACRACTSGPSCKLCSERGRNQPAFYGCVSVTNNTVCNKDPDDQTYDHPDNCPDSCSQSESRQCGACLEGKSGRQGMSTWFPDAFTGPPMLNLIPPPPPPTPHPPS
jgi:hypothetical protein